MLLKKKEPYIYLYTLKWICSQVNLLLSYLIFFSKFTWGHIHFKVLTFLLSLDERWKIYIYIYIEREREREKGEREREL